MNIIDFNKKNIVNYLKEKNIDIKNINEIFIPINSIDYLCD